MIRFSSDGWSTLRAAVAIVLAEILPFTAAPQRTFPFVVVRKAGRVFPLNLGARGGAEPFPARWRGRPAASFMNFGARGERTFPYAVARRPARLSLDFGARGEAGPFPARW